MLIVCSPIEAPPINRNGGRNDVRGANIAPPLDDETRRRLNDLIFFCLALLKEADTKFNQMTTREERVKEILKLVDPDGSLGLTVVELDPEVHSEAQAIERMNPLDNRQTRTYTKDEIIALHLVTKPPCEPQEQKTES